MGYETTFHGSFAITPALETKHLKYLDAFGSTRRMKRDAERTEKMSDELRTAVGLPVGVEGAYFVGDQQGFCGQTHTDDIIDYNHPPIGQPELWCGWSPSEDGAEYYAQDGKNYGYVEWLEYLIEHFLGPWGYNLNGEICWEGEDNPDLGKIKVADNKVKVLKGTVTYR
jgi:hypothetical protein